MDYKVKAVSKFLGSTLYGTLRKHSEHSLLFTYKVDNGKDRPRNDYMLVSDVESCVSFIIDDLGFTWFTFNQL